MTTEALILTAVAIISAVALACMYYLDTQDDRRAIIRRAMWNTPAEEGWRETGAAATSGSGPGQKENA